MLRPGLGGSPVRPLAALSFGAFAQDAAVNCGTAQEDIAHLHHEKKSTDERAVKGVMSIMPIDLASNTTDEAAKGGSHKETDVKDYNQKLSERIAEIKQACGVQ